MHEGPSLFALTLPRLRKTRQHDIGHDGADDTALLGTSLWIVAAVEHHDEITRGNDRQDLATPTDTTEPVQRLRAACTVVAHVPVIAVVADGAGWDHGRGHALHPASGNDGRSVPGSAGEHELSDLDEIARQQAQA